MKIHDHTPQGEKQAALPAAKSLTLPKRPTPADRTTIRRLRQVPKRHFDCAYMSAQIRGHVATIGLFVLEVRAGSDPDVRAFAARWLPPLRMHLRLARQIADQLNC